MPSKSRRRSSRKTILPPRLINALESGRLVPFVGSGVSRSAAPAKFPNWLEFVQLMNQTALSARFITKNVHHQIATLLKQEKYLLAVEALKRYMPEDAYKMFFEENFLYTDKDKVDLSLQTALLETADRLIITTNFDRLLEDAFALHYKRAPTVSTFRDPYVVQATLQQQSLSASPLIFKLHGDIADITSIILSERDYRTLMFDHQSYESVLVSIFVNYVVLFVGFSLSDREIMMHVAKLRHQMQYFSHPHFALISDKDPNDVEDAVFRQSYGVDIIRYSAASQHRELREIIQSMADHSRGSR
jgi:hypothetical protein